MPVISRTEPVPHSSQAHNWASILFWVIIIGLAVVVFHALTSTLVTSRSAAAALGVMLSGGCLLVGGFLGFLFGVPRSLQKEPGQAPAKPSEKAVAGGERTGYSANTNLEQISDWLTKILVGVGLTQLTELPARLKTLAAYFGPALGGPDYGPPITLALVMFFTIAGFLFGYLWTRLFLGPELAEADVNSIVASIKEEQDKQSQTDAAALSLVKRYLDLDTPLDKISVDELKKAVEAASPAIKVQIYYQASDVRSQSWKNNKPLMERTIPIFEALVASDKEERFHKNYGDLGFALKDKRIPDYKAAEAALTKAIQIRGPAAQTGWVFYEFCRALCRIQQDSDFHNNKPSSAEKVSAITQDLKFATMEVPDLFNNADILRWLELNHLKIDQLKTPSA